MECFSVFVRLLQVEVQASTVCVCVCVCVCVRERDIKGKDDNKIYIAYS